MSEIRNVSGTAFVVAELRAEENREVTPLYRDSVVGLFLRNFKTSELYQAYWLGRPMTSPIFGFYSVCTLGF